MSHNNQFFLVGTLFLVILVAACGRIQVDIVPTSEPMPRPSVPITPTPWFGPAQYETEAGVIFDDRLKLLGYSVTPDSDQPGSRVTVTLIWEVLDKIDAEYNTFVHLLNEQGQLLAESDRPTGGGYRQSSSWIIKEYVYDQHHLQLPVSTSLDDVSIQIGLYEFKDGRRIDVQSPNTYTLEVTALPTPGRPLLPTMTPRPYHPTPYDALTEWPGKLEDAHPAVLESVRVLKEEEVAGGVVILYSIPVVEAGENTLASTFVTPEDDGWRAQSSGWTGYSSADQFVAAYTVGGNITDLTTAYGISHKGESVRVAWSDGQVDTAPIENESFVFARPVTLTVQRIELLDGSGGVLESREFGTEAAEPAGTPDQAETPGEILMATPTATPHSLTGTPTRVKTGIPQVDQAIAAVLSNDVKTRRSLIRYTTINCTHELGMGGPPKCEPGQEEGTPVEKFPILGPGEGEHIDPQAIDRVLGFRVQELYAAYRRADKEDRDSSFPAGTFGLVFFSDGAFDELSHFLVHLDEEGRIVRLDFVAWPLEHYFEQEVGEWLLEPQT